MKQHNSIDIEQTQKFLSLFGNNPDCFQTFDDAKKGRGFLTSPALIGNLDRFGSHLTNLNEKGAGIFFTVNQTDGKGRKTHNIDKVRALYVDADKDGDLVLSRVRDWHLKPHCIVESSPGKYHIYWLVNDCPLAEFSIFQGGLAELFDTDRNVKALAGVTRLPGFIHKKTDSGHMTRIVWLDEDLPAYSIEDFRKHLDLEEKHNGSDELDAFFANLPGDFTNEDVQEVLDRLDPDELEYDEWLNVGFGLNHQFEGDSYGYKLWLAWSERSKKHHEDNMPAKWRSFGKRKPGRPVTFATVARMLKIQEERAAEAEGEKVKWWENWVYAGVPDRFVKISNRQLYKKDAFNSINSKYCSKFTPAKIALQVKKIQLIDDLMYYPGKERIFEYKGSRYINSFREDSIITPVEPDAEGWEAIKTFNEHLELIIESEEERQLLIDFLAYVYQNPGKRINWVLVLQGGQGCGKTYLNWLMEQLLGDNCGRVDSGDIKGNYSSWAAHSTISFIDELVISGESKYATLDHLKPFITNDQVIIKEKFLPTKKVINTVNYVILTNYKDAIPVGYDDRRYCVIFSRIQTPDELKELVDPDYFNRLYGLTGANAGAMAWFFQNHKISENFNPTGAAPMTEAKGEMIEYGKCENEELLEEIIEDHECAVLNKDIISVTYLRWLAKQYPADVTIPKLGILKKILLRKGYKKLSGGRVKDGKGNKHDVWIKHKTEITRHNVLKLFKKFEPQTAEDEIDKLLD